MAARTSKEQELEPAELATRVEELEAAIATALKVNKLLNAEVEKYVCAAEQLQAERDAWQRQAQRLAGMHAAQRRQAAGGSGGPAEEGEDLAAMLQLQEKQAEAAAGADEGPSTSGMAVEPTPSQLQAIKSLVARGKAAGWLIKPDEVTLGPELGKGTFGTTYRGRWQGAEVAIKCVRVSTTTELTTFLREVEAMSLVRHPNIVPFLGACLQSDHFWLLAEFMPGGTMATWLKGTPPTPGSVTTGGAALPSPRSLAIRARAGLEVAQGMQALHCQSPCIMHRDLKPSNIFMDAGGHARIGDFGLSRRLLPHESRATLTGETGTYLYMAPEVMRHDVYDLRCDVWSWGVLWAELMDEGRLPYWHLYMTPVQIALAVAEERLQPHIPDHLPTDLQVIGRLACQFDPDSRPSFATIIAELEPAVTKELEHGSRRTTFLDTVQRFTSSWGGIMGRAIYALPNQGAGAAGATGRPGQALARRLVTRAAEAQPDKLSKQSPGQLGGQQAGAASK